MASPLLESGAIDGAKGILINITGSSNLKLNEVFEASTIIQNAAHEDANIIFGAVQDESMGDDVKITVIATGFKEEMPQRRERMLQGTALPASRFEAAPPPPPRIAQRPQPTPAPFASEIQAGATEAVVEEKKSARKKNRDEVRETASVPEPIAVQPPPPAPAPAPTPFARAEEPLRITPPAEPLRVVPPVEPLRVTPPAEPLRVAPRAEEPLRVTPSEPLRVPNEPLRITPPREPEPERVHGAYVPAASVEPKPELVPVPASVFDDDFFRKSNDELRPAPEPRSWEAARETMRQTPRETEEVRESREAENSREFDEVGSQQKKTETHWPEARVPSFAGYAGGSSSSSDEDELDIPAFLRRSR
jgi:cell division protein FtsZ